MVENNESIGILLPRRSYNHARYSTINHIYEIKTIHHDYARHELAYNVPKLIYKHNLKSDHIK